MLESLMKVPTLTVVLKMYHPLKVAATETVSHQRTKAEAKEIEVVAQVVLEALEQLVAEEKVEVVSLTDLVRKEAQQPTKVATQTLIHTIDASMVWAQLLKRCKIQWA